MPRKVDKFDELDVWEPVKPHPGMKVLGMRWVLAHKLDEEGRLLERRSRLVVKGFNQRMGEDVHETYAPAASLKVLRVLISLAVNLDLPMATFDVSSAYLYSPISKELYAQPPTEVRPEWKDRKSVV